MNQCARSMHLPGGWSASLCNGTLPYKSDSTARLAVPVWQLGAHLRFYKMHIDKNSALRDTVTSYGNSYSIF